MLAGWDLYDTALAHMFEWEGSVDRYGMSLAHCPVLLCLVFYRSYESFTLGDLLSKPWISRAPRFLPSSRHLPSFLSRIGFSIPVFSFFCARRFASNFANSRSSTLGLSFCNNESHMGLQSTTSASIIVRLTIEPLGTPL